jgi:glycosyltransferase involved in cell wall biosynthesis
MEAMMCGRATVSTAVGGVPEVAGDAGVVVPPRDPAAFGDALADLLLDEQRRVDLGARARERALQTFPLDLMLDRFRRTYARLSAPATAPTSGSLAATYELPHARMPIPAIAAFGSAGPA